MSKRFIFPQQQGERKKAKLNVTKSDHNFPLSQNQQEQDADNWGDDNDDEILLLASQACEQAYNNDISSLPDYSMCMQPQSTRTQISDPGPSTSKTGFTFKKPSTCTPNAVTTNLKNKCSMISSPLRGMSMNVIPKVTETVNITDDLIFNDKVYKGQDSDQLYRQLLQMQEENAKLKSENGKLLEKCVTKEGEASILRTQLKTCQVAVDNARLEKIKAQEKVQMEWTDKLASANMQLQDLRTQLDFKNLEIISVKEKCKKLESSKIRLTQVTVGNHDISTSHRNNNSIAQNESIMQHRRIKTTTNATQTMVPKDQFFRLNKSCTIDNIDLSGVLPLILEPTALHHNILDYNEKLQKHTDSQNKCRVYSTFHRLPSTPNTGKEVGRNKLVLASVYEDLTHIAAGRPFDELVNKYCNTFKAVKLVLQEVQSELEVVSQRATTAFQKEMDEKYIEATSTYLVVEKEDLLVGRSLYKEEQALLARRIVAVLAFLLRNSKAMDMFVDLQKDKRINSNETHREFLILDSLQGICGLLESTSCATLYSGLLLSITSLLSNIRTHSLNELKVHTLKAIICSRAMPFVVSDVLNILRDMSGVLKEFCPGVGAGNLKLDYDQGVLLFKKDSCYLQVLLKQVEASLKCAETQKLTDVAVTTTGNLIAVHANMDGDRSTPEQKQTKCDCQLVLIQIIVYGLRICADMLRNSQSTGEGTNGELLAVCQCGAAALFRCALRDLEFGSRLGYHEGHLLHFCETLGALAHNDLYSNMLSEISGTFQTSPEDMPTPYHRQAWLSSFDKFCIAD